MIISYSGFSCSVNASLKRVHLFCHGNNCILDFNNVPRSNDYFICQVSLQYSSISFHRLLDTCHYFLFFHWSDIPGCVDSINHKWRLVLPSTSNCCCLKWRAKNPWHDFWKLPTFNSAIIPNMQVEHTIHFWNSLNASNGPPLSSPLQTILE